MDGQDHASKSVHSVNSFDHDQILNTHKPYYIDNLMPNFFNTNKNRDEKSYLSMDF